MVYKALEDIGGYKKGEVVPDAEAEVWAKQYLHSPVEKVEGSEPEPEKEEKKEESPSNSILEDYLGRNENVVKKNVEEDKLSKGQLKNLLEIEKPDKNRKAVIKAIQKRLNE